MLTPQQAYAAIDLDVIVFLLGLMLIVGYLECLAVTPVLLTALGALGVRPTSYLLALAMEANVGSVVSVTGKPQNMLVGIWSGASFGGFFIHPTSCCADLAAFGVAVAGWLAGWPLPGVAIAAGGLTVPVARRDPAYAIERVDWDLLLFFASLFVVMRGLEATGAVAGIDQHALALAHGASPWRDAAMVSGVMVTLSNLISNVPAVILWRHRCPPFPIRRSCGASSP